MEYLNFDVELTEVSEGRCRVRAKTEHWGEATDDVVIDPTAPTFADQLASVAADTADAGHLQAFGEILFRLLFPHRVKTLLMTSLGDAEAHRKGLRIRLRIDPRWRAIPWELAYFTQRHRYLGADVRTPVTRRPDAMAPAATVTGPLPLKVLVVAPQSSRLRADEELDHLRQALEPLDAFIETDVLDRSRPITLRRVAERLGSKGPHVFHFIGHGSFASGSGSLFLDDRRGEPLAVTDAQIRSLFVNARSVRLVVLNSCEGAATESQSGDLSGVAQHLVAVGTPAVLAHRYPIRDEAAIRFSEEFYSSLVTSPERGLVEAALARARNQLNVCWPHSRIVGASVLYVRSSGPLFQLDIPAPMEIDRLHARVEVAQRHVRLLRHEVASQPESARLQDQLDQAMQDTDAVMLELDRAQRRRTESEVWADELG